MAYKNWQTARLTGGKFIVIFDDTMHSMSRPDRQGFSIDEAADRWIEDMTWVGLVPDDIHFSREFEDQRNEVLSQLGLTMPIGIGVAQGLDRWIPIPYPDMSKGIWYSPAIVAGRVVDDRCLDIGGFWRGKEIIGEWYLYDFIGHQLRYPQVAQGYIPTVAREIGTKCSQSVVQISIRNLKDAGYEPWQIVETLLECEMRSTLTGSAQIMIPDGCLTLESVSWLRFEGDASYLKGILEEIERHNSPEWEDTARAWMKEYTSGLKGRWPI